MTTAAPMPVPFPFAAIAGQPHLRQALLLAAVDPGLGGVLIEGPRGTAKTTAARALAELLPGAPFVTLPLGASLESLVGTLDLAKALAGHELAFAPGLLARAHGGVLYVDEINLLPDALIDSLLDAAASGVNVVERDGISHRHAARFVLVGTMNPEEGTLRPQLLDRFGLCVQLRNIDDPAGRQAIVRARLAFDADPQGFRAKHAQEEAALAASLARARALVADTSALPYGDAVHEAVGALCIAAGVDGLRADLVMLRSVRALAAWEGADEITADHVRRVAEAVLLHRRKPEAEAAAPSPAPLATRPDATANGQRGTNGTGDEDWGAMPPEPVGIERVKPLRPLIAPAQAVAPKKA
ncbi:ATP-binding protein [Variovorax sp. NFACC27]|uniref:ATP-binding protein n=1 Tax=unclassified Variovorax TaxID=663243 RepID=UPI0008994132|nr:protoporphyrin IX magnesium-chelatase [Variovorax sp. NFACC28]SEG84658.1 protoporphyrin IX magnesium-chelatase [Variovorax sp. NFACC29]SFD18115.1 protoporphyrin IX magnesium-chelatase [Variovorax sp. NFACC26]SFG25429.1 protoporphyrin IX magnesium-chelatase [Variovorax sp. NFACC27]